MKHSITLTQHEVMEIIADYVMDHQLRNATEVNISFNVRFGELECTVREVR